MKTTTRHRRGGDGGGGGVRRFCNVNLLTSLLMIATYHSFCSVYYVSIRSDDCQQQYDVNGSIIKPSTRMKNKEKKRYHHHNGMNDRFLSHSLSSSSLSRQSSFQNMSWNLKLTSNQKYLDIGVPISGQDEKLIHFVSFLGSSIKQFRENVQGDKKHHDDIHFRLLITRYANDNATTSFQDDLAKKAFLDVKNVEFVLSDQKQQFQRSNAHNLLHQHTRHDDANSILAVIDVDLLVGPHFIVNALNYVSSVGKFYFPIVFSNYRPSNVLLVEIVLGPLPEYDQHKGLWRDFGYGIYALSGIDAKDTLMDENFTGWGGEDNDFYERVKAKKDTSIVREREHDLIHVWHPKYCDLGSIVSSGMIETCQNSRNVMEGSKFGQYILNVSLTEPAHFETLVKARSSSSESKYKLKREMKRAISMRKTEYAPGRDPLEAFIIAKLSNGTTNSRELGSTKPGGSGDQKAEG